MGRPRVRGVDPPPARTGPTVRLWGRSAEGRRYWVEFSADWTPGGVQLSGQGLDGSSFTFILAPAEVNELSALLRRHYRTGAPYVVDEEPDREPSPEQERAWDLREDDARGSALGDHVAGHDWEHPLRWRWDSDAQHTFRRCLDCGAEVWAFREGLVCSGCQRSADEE